MYNLGEQFARDYSLSLANPDSVFQGTKYRFTILSESLIRIEYNKNGIFEDRPTELVWYRNFEKPEFTVKQDAKYLEIETEGNYFTLKDKKLKLFFFFSFDGLKKSEVVFAFNRILGDWSATIYCNNVSPEVLDFSKRFSNKINIQSGEDLYAEIKDFLPLSVLPRTTFNERKSLKPFLSKKSARKTFLFGALFLIISSFVTFKTYYVVFGTIFLIFSFVNYFFSKTA